MFFGSFCRIQDTFHVENGHFHMLSAKYSRFIYRRELNDTKIDQN